MAGQNGYRERGILRNQTTVFFTFLVDSKLLQHFILSYHIVSKFLFWGEGGRGGIYGSIPSSISFEVKTAKNRRRLAEDGIYFS